MFRRAALLAVLLATGPTLATAEDWYAGHSFLLSSDANACVIVRFKAVDGSYTLSQADGLFTFFNSILESQDLSGTGVTINTTWPSQNHNAGITGEGLTETFLSSGRAVCKVGGQPVDAVAFISTFRCEYQLENQMCFRLYVDTGEMDLSMIGVPSGPAAIGGTFINRQVWDPLFALMLGSGGSFGAGDLSETDMGAAGDGLDPEAALSTLLAPVTAPLQLLMPTP